MADNVLGVSELSAWRGPCARTARDRVKVRTEGRRQATRSRKPSQLGDEPFPTELMKGRSDRTLDPSHAPEMQKASAAWPPLP
jgi:hypothetical protein